MKNYKIILLTLCILAQECKAPSVEVARPTDIGRPIEVSGEPVDVPGRAIDAAGKPIVDVAGTTAKTADVVNSLSLAIQAKGGKPLTIIEKAALSNSISQAKASGSWDAFNAHFDQILQAKEGHSVDKAAIDAALEQAEATGTFDNFFNSVDLYFSKAAAPLVEIFRGIADYFSSSSTPVPPSGATGTNKGAVISSPVLEPAAPIAEPATPAPTVKSAPAKITPGSSTKIFADVSFDPTASAINPKTGASLTPIDVVTAHVLEELTKVSDVNEQLAGQAGMKLLGLDPTMVDKITTLEQETAINIALDNQITALKSALEITTYADLAKNPQMLTAVNNLLARSSLPTLTAKTSRADYINLTSNATDIVNNAQTAAEGLINFSPLRSSSAPSGFLS